MLLYQNKITPGQQVSSRFILFMYRKGRVNRLVNNFYRIFESVKVA